MIQIKSTRIFRKGIATQIEIAVSNYEPNGDSVALTWQLKDAAGVVLDNDTEVLGNDVVSQWNSNDDVLTNALLQKLGLEKA
jgi:hypothetical protein